MVVTDAFTNPGERGEDADTDDGSDKEDAWMEEPTADLACCRRSKGEALRS